jgi:hypothetical protein
MVQSSDRRIGFDFAGENRKKAEVLLTVNGPRIISVSTLSLSAQVLPDTDENNAGKVLSVPDNLVMVKEVCIACPQANNIEEQLQFELKHSLPDSPDDFCYDTIATAQENRFICMITRKALLKEILPENQRISGFVMRAVALGRGFLHYCENQSEGLIALVDFSDRRAALCIINDQKIAALGHFDWKRLTDGGDRDMFRVAAELKTLLNFKLNSLNRNNKISNLERLYLCGYSFTDAEKEILSRKLSIRISEPIIDQACLPDSTASSEFSAGDFLVALGLTTE